MAKKDFSSIGEGTDNFKKQLEQFKINPDDKPIEREDKIFSQPEKKKRSIRSEKKVPAPEKKRDLSDLITEKEVKPISSDTEMPDDFKAHSVLVSKEQLNLLQEIVLKRKLEADKKYSIKQAFFEALDLRINQKQAIDCEYPDDFITYSPLISENQLVKLNKMVYQRKINRGDKKYSIQRAVYEAVQLYIEVNG